ncbi:aldehyde dehydrogenase/conjugal transfer protein [Gluconobacter thailandicus F149-1 = NBRC 100600]|uniref:Conjugal transfer protein n=5 Tax=Acetobacteraceae TaxID=433 RepID=A0ABQ0IX85_GLUTH|nr:MobF family relaxase [Gluconobacter thailandicus]KXV54309.1 aldehyde dehydrogenase [Gluconobacter thailandicus]GAC89389.1 conjugal transfer protein [Gluconobacter thailandicus NBRC 3255]GAD26809.1 conjugal transfer protein [Gluconobacter thailandicus NBRC 3257]GAN93603.1 aldehyde dehydrogenase/conjugal transfer protein [Gluconobacter thailandicus F149-1 = NBRC 100600]GBR61389.1 conjugal transfer protein [Gluconobacter thailandicus F149-1 = NBRC 100600]
MLTYRTGAAGATSAAKAMSEHLLQQTLPPEMAVMAEYYAQGVRPPTPAEAAATRYAGTTSGMDDLADTLAMEIDRLREATSDSDNVLAVRAAGTFVAANLIDRAKAEELLQQRAVPFTADALDSEIRNASAARDYSSATAIPRRDMNPELAARLGIDPTKGLTPAEVAHLLNGQRADGQDIPGKTKRSATEAIGKIFEMDESRLPTRSELEAVLAGKTVSGGDIPAKKAERAVRRFTAVLGADAASLTNDQRENILSGRMADGQELSVSEYHERMDTSRARIGYVDFTFSAPKSVSVAWAFAPTEAERGIILQAHHDAIASTMQEVEKVIGRARKGDAGKDGWDPASIGWVSFDHYTARPTVEVIRTDDQGEVFTELHTLRQGGGRVPGDMQLHTHTAILNAALTDEGRMGGLWLDQLNGKVKEWGAVYQAHLATNLRKQGVDMVLDERTEMGRVAAIPESVCEQFSRRTLSGTAAARAYAAGQGLDWDTLDAKRKIGLIKQGVQDPRGAKSDDLTDMASWQRTAAEIGYKHRSILRPDEIAPERDRAERLEHAYEAAQHVFDKQLQQRASLDCSDARIAAAKGLIAAGIDTAADINAVTAAMRNRGVRQHGRQTSLIWGEVKDPEGRERVGITTALHESEERDLIRMTREAAKDRSGALTDKQIDQAVKAHPELSFESAHGQAQRTMMEDLGKGGQVVVGIGVAGSGKTTLLKPLVTAWKQQGRDVHGIALAWRQSDDLSATGMEVAKTRALESFLRRIDSGKLKLTKKSVVVVDELSLLGTRQLNDILRKREDIGFKLVMIGDPKQMQSVEAGAVIELLQRGLGKENIPLLGTSTRQIQQEERETTLMFRNGQTEEAVKRKAENGTLRVAPGGYEEAIKAVVDLWQQRRTENADRDKYTLSISTPTNADAHNISRAIRDRRRELGEISADLITIKAQATGENTSYDLSLARGDKVRLFQRTNARFLDTNSGGNLGRNGTVVEVRDVREEGLVLRGANGRNGLVKWDSLKEKETGRFLLSYGDAMTTNTSQGVTVTEHIFAIPAGSRNVTAFGAYTSSSRHREQTFMVTSDGAERSEIAGRRPLGDQRTITATDVLKNIIRNFERQPEKETAHALLERAENIRRGTVRAMQQTKQGLEAREGEGKQRATLAGRFSTRRHEQKASEGLKNTAEAMKDRNGMMDRLREMTKALKAKVRTILSRKTEAKAQEKQKKRRSARL